MKKKLLIQTFFLFFILFNSVYAYLITDAPEAVSSQDGYEFYSYGYAMDCIHPYSLDVSSNTGFDCTGSGLWNEYSEISYLTTLPDYSVVPPLIAELDNSTEPRITYLIRIEDDSLNLHYYNTSLNQMVQKDSIALHDALFTYSSEGIYTSPILYKGTAERYPKIATIEENSSTYFMHVYQYNSTDLFEVCHKQVQTSGAALIHATLLYDWYYEFIILSTLTDGNRNYIQIFDGTSEVCNSPHYTYDTVSNSYTHNLPHMASGHVGSYYDGTELARDLIVPTSAAASDESGYLAWTLNSTHVLGLNSEWDDNCKYLGLFQECDCVNGRCTEFSDFGESQSAPVFTDIDGDGWDEIIFAIYDDTEEYHIVGIDKNGDFVFRSKPNTVMFGNCEGTGNTNVTGWQPVITSHPDGTFPTGSAYTKENAVCGACMPQGDTTIYIECFDLYTSDSLTSTSIDINTELFRNRYTTAYYKPRWLNMISYNIDSSTPEPEIIVSDKIFDINLNLIQDLGFLREDTVVSVAKLIPYSEYNTNDTQIILWTNQTTRIYKSGKENELAEFVTGSNKVTPDITNCVSLNFSRDYGITFQYTWNEPEVSADVEYYRYWCEYPTDIINQTYNNFVNWTSIIDSSNPVQVMFTCRYNSSGIKTSRIEVSDEHHFNLSSPEFIYDSQNINIVDLPAPLCEADYNSELILNPEDETEECTRDTDCPVGSVCIDNTCTEETCTTDDDCPTGSECIDSSCIAISCVLDSDCPSGYQCENGACTSRGMEGAIDEFLDTMGIRSSNDRAILWIVLMVLLAILFSYGGMALGAVNKSFNLKIYFFMLFFLEICFLLLGFKLGFVALWIVILIFLIVGIIGAYLIIHFTTGGGNN